MQRKDKRSTCCETSVYNSMNLMREISSLHELCYNKINVEIRDKDVKGTFWG